MHHRVAAALALVASALAIAGCGDEAVEVDGRTVSVRLDEYRIVPQTISAPAGTLRVVARNDGLLTHNLVIETVPKRLGVAPTRLRQLKTLHPGERTQRSVTLKPGTYRLLCTIANHETLGQHGELVIVGRGG